MHYLKFEIHCMLKIFLRALFALVAELLTRWSLDPKFRVRSLEKREVNQKMAKSLKSLCEPISNLS